MTLCAAIVHGCSKGALRSYMQSYHGKEKGFKETMKLATPVLYYAIARNDRDMVDVLLEYCMNPAEPKDKNDMVPPVAFAIV
jgi:hypothetical protein